MSMESLPSLFSSVVSLEEASRLLRECLQGMSCGGVGRGAKTRLVREATAVESRYVKDFAGARRMSVYPVQEVIVDPATMPMDQLLDRMERDGQRGDVSELRERWEAISRGYRSLSGSGLGEPDGRYITREVQRRVDQYRSEKEMAIEDLKATSAFLAKSITDARAQQLDGPVDDGEAPPDYLLDALNEELKEVRAKEVEELADEGALQSDPDIILLAEKLAGLQEAVTAANVDLHHARTPPVLPADQDPVYIDLGRRHHELDAKIEAAANANLPKRLHRAVVRQAAMNLIVRQVEGGSPFAVGLTILHANDGAMSLEEFKSKLCDKLGAGVVLTTLYAMVGHQLVDIDRSVADGIVKSCLFSNEPNCA